MQIPRSADSTFRVAVYLLLTVLVSSAAAQQEQFREREVLDPASDEWVEQPLEDQGEPADDLDQARGYLATGKYGKAYRLLTRWTQANPDHDRYYEGMYLLGEAQFERNHFYQAYEAYEVVAEARAGELFYQALRREMDVARAFLSGEKRIVWKVLYLPAYDDGIEILDRIWERVPGTRLGEQALKLKADYFFAVGDVDLAQDEYVNLTREYPNGRYVQLAMLRGAEAAAAAFPGIKFDDRALLNAQVRYEQLGATFPAYAEHERVGDRLEGIRQQRAEKDLDVARWYERTKQAGAAEYYYRLVLHDWPDTLAAGEARRALRDMGVVLAEEDSQP
jgi:outer membrane protein assembly factor BamD (BamD/ComL family)